MVVIAGENVRLSLNYWTFAPGQETTLGVVSAESGSLLDMQNLVLHLRPRESEFAFQPETFLIRVHIQIRKVLL